MHHLSQRPASGPLVIFSDRTGWHEARLVAALARRDVKPVVVSLGDVGLDIGARVPVLVPGCGGRIPRAAMVRGIPAGTFEAVMLRLDVIRGLEELGTTVWNGASAIARCVDKSATSLALARAGIPTPRTVVTASRARALDFLAREIGVGNKVVLKPLFGSKGQGLRLMERVRDLPEPETVNDVYYLQRFVPPVGGRFEDYRLFVSRGAVVAGMARRGGGWITNVHQGAVPMPLDPRPEMARLALAAAAAVGACFAGVDLMVDADGSPTVLEVNSMPAWRGLQTAATTDVADRLAADWLAAAGMRAEPALTRM